MLHLGQKHCRSKLKNYRRADASSMSECGTRRKKGASKGKQHGAHVLRVLKLQEALPHVSGCFATTTAHKWDLPWMTTEYVKVCSYNLPTTVSRWGTYLDVHVHISINRWAIKLQPQRVQATVWKSPWPKMRPLLCWIIKCISFTKKAPFQGPQKLAQVPTCVARKSIILPHAYPETQLF